MGERPTCGYCGGEVLVTYREEHAYIVDTWEVCGDKLHSDAEGDAIQLLDRQRTGYRCRKCGKYCYPSTEKP